MMPMPLRPTTHLPAITEPLRREEIRGRILNKYLELIPPDFPVPLPLISSLLDKYTAIDLLRLETNFRTIFDDTLRNKAVGEKNYLLTTGCPEEGKQPLFERESPSSSNAVFIDPDTTCLDVIIERYCAALQKELDPVSQMEHWVEGAIFIETVMLAHAIRSGYPIIHASPAMHPISIELLDYLKTAGYSRTLVHVSSSNKEVALSARNYTAKTPRTGCFDTNHFSHKYLLFYKARAEKLTVYLDQGDADLVLAEQYTPKTDFIIVNSEAYKALD